MIKMQKRLRNVTMLCFVGGIFAGQAQGASQCPEDARLAQLTGYMKTNDLKTVDPLNLSVPTYLALPSSVRNAWGDNVVIFDDACEKTPVSGGMPERKIRADFEVLFHAFYNAAIRKDQGTNNLILSHFRAKPVSAALAFSMSGRSGFTPPMVNGLTKAAGISKHAAKKLGTGAICKNEADNGGNHIYAEISMLDFFLRFGGVLEGDAGQIYISGNDKDHWWLVREDMHRQLDTDVPDVRGRGCAYLDPARLKKMLSGLGFTFVEKSQLPDDLKAYRREYMNPVAEEEENHKKSLFE